MKSAYELAMERLAGKEGKRVPLTDSQKRKIAEVESQMKARIAEIEIMMQKNLAEARAAGDFEKVALLEKSKLDDVRKARSRAESEKEEIRGG
jgi:hypothetical protein